VVEEMNQFGVTNPCAKIAAHFKVPQGLVDASMEYKLVERGIRTNNNWPTHVHQYAAGMNYPDDDTKYQVHFALQLVCDDILELAGR
jgi:hypothetical protein